MGDVHLRSKPYPLKLISETVKEERFTISRAPLEGVSIATGLEEPDLISSAHPFVPSNLV
jgi:hypothetical protein